jgi:uncharacterized delta-60 repeat protein
MRASFTITILVIASPVFGQAGTLDTGFSFDGYVTTTPDEGGGANAVGVQSDGRIIVAGNAYDNMMSEMRACVIRYLPDGQLDLSFGTNGLKLFRLNNWNTSLTGMVVLDDDRIVVAGTGFPANDSDPYIARLLPDGDFDTSFSGDGICSVDLNGDGLLRGLTVDNAGRYVAVGQFGTSTSTELLLMRTMPDGSFDQAFGSDGIATASPGLQQYSTGMRVHGATNGALIVAGMTVLNTAADTVQMLIARFLEDGTMDPGFGALGGVIVAYPTAMSVPMGLHVEPNGDVLVVGAAGDDNGSDLAMVRLLSDGALDASFGVLGQVLAEIGPDRSGATDLFVQADGHFLVVGGTAVNDETDLLMARFRPDGTLDPVFAQAGVSLIPVPGSPSISCMSVQPDLQLLVAGTMNPSASFFTARLLTGLGVGLHDQPSESEFVLYPNPGSGAVRLRVPSGELPERIFVLDATGRSVHGLSPVSMSLSEARCVDLSTSELPAGLYSVVVEMKGSTQRMPFIRI